MERTDLLRILVQSMAAAHTNADQRAEASTGWSVGSTVVPVARVGAVNVLRRTLYDQRQQAGSLKANEFEGQ